jgi:hypothetical protein
MAALEAIYELFTSKLPRHARILLTVSPVPFTCTFSDREVVVANTYSKATLRAVAQDFSERYEQIDYVPVFESVTNSTDIAWEPDRIHVTDIAVRANVLHFLANYLADAAKSSHAAVALSKLLGGNRVDRRRKRKVPLPDFELAATDTSAFPAGLPEISASSEMARNYGPRFLGSGPARENAGRLSAIDLDQICGAAQAQGAVAAGAGSPRRSRATKVLGLRMQRQRRTAAAAPVAQQAVLGFHRLGLLALPPDKHLYAVRDRHRRKLREPGAADAAAALVRTRLVVPYRGKRQRSRRLVIGHAGIPSGDCPGNR